MSGRAYGDVFAPRTGRYGLPTPRHDAHCSTGAVHLHVEGIFSPTKGKSELATFNARRKHIKKGPITRPWPKATQHKKNHILVPHP